MPPMPKHSSTRARTNKSSTAATLVADPDFEAPDLPPGVWNDQTREWWVDVWASPMAPEYDDSDRHGLFQLARLVNDFWSDDMSFRDRVVAAAEIRQQSQRFGLSPLDRRRLQWEIERSEEARDKGEKRKAAKKTAGSKSKGDPRATLHAV